MRPDAEKDNLIKAIDALEKQLFVVSPGFEILAANAAAMRACGDDCIGKKCYEVFCKEKAPCAACNITHTFQASSDPVDGESAAGGSPSALPCGYIVPIYTDGQVEAAVCTDIDLIKRAGKAGNGQLANAFLKSLIHTSPDAVVVTNPQGNILLINEAARKLAGYTEAEIYAGLNIKDVYPDEKAYDVMARLRSDHYGGRGKLKAYHAVILDKTGQRIPIRLDAAIVYDGDKEIATLGYFRDLRDDVQTPAGGPGTQSEWKDAQSPQNLERIVTSVARGLKLYNQQFGDTAIRIGLIDSQQLHKALAHQEQLQEKTSVDVPLGRVLVQLDFITEEQRTAILAMQALSEDDPDSGEGSALGEKARQLAKDLEIYNQRFGDLALRLGFISADQLERSLQMQKQVCAKTKIDIPLGRVLEQLDYITEEQRAAVLAVQALGDKRASSEGEPASGLTGAEAPRGETIPEVDSGETDVVSVQPEPEPEEPEPEPEEPEPEPEEPEPDDSTLDSVESELESAESEPGLEEQKTEKPDTDDEEAEAEARASEIEADETDNKIRNYFAVEIAEDKLSARLVAKSREREEQVFTDLLDLIEAEGIRFGLVEEGVLKAFFTDDSETLEPLVIAEGYPPGEGQDPEIEFHFETDYLKAGKMQEDGTIDWKDRGEIPQVEEGDLLAQIIPGVYGAVGMDVLGNEIPADPIAKVNLTAGKGVKKSSDGNSFTASAKGTPGLSENQTLTVSPILVIEGDVGIETGHIEFDGHVEVAGTIQDGYQVRATSLRAQGMKNAEVFIAGDIVVTGGIFESKLKCQGNVKAGHVNKSDIDAAGDLVIDKEIIDSEVELQGACQADYGTIISSRIAARNGILVQNVGTAMSKASHLDVGVDHKLRREMSGLKKLFSKAERKKKEIQPQVKTLRAESDQINAELGEVAQKQDQVMVQLRQLQEKFAGQASLDESVKAGYEKAVAELEARRGQMDKVVAALMQKDSELEKVIGELEEQETEITDEQAELEERMEMLRERRETEKGKPVVKVSGDIFTGNKITGPKSKIIIDEDRHHVNIFETDKADDGQFARWHMKIGPLR
jgi:PAS domain S-box-containing protein